MKTLGKNVITFPFTEGFIDHFADYLAANYVTEDRDMSKLAIVFGGKRPALFLRRALAKCIGQGFIAPRIFTIDDFIAYTIRQSQSFTKANDLDQAYVIYDLARTYCPDILKGRANFAAFLPWAQEILRFIDQLDLEDVDNNRLAALKENAAIGYGVPDEINGLLRHIITIRTKYHAHMRETKMYSRGFKYFTAARMINDFDMIGIEHIIFANFFYFNRSEEAVVKNLFDREMATFVFQGDARRWPVLARTAKRFQIDISEGDEPKPTTFDLKLYKGFDAHSQIGLVRGVLGTIKEHEKTVIVLPNPDHIVPLLSEVASIAKDFNISMGYPLKRSSLYALIQMVFRAQLSFDNGRYYAKDYLKVLRHPFVKNLNLTGDPQLTRILVHKIEEILTGMEPSGISGSLFIRLEDVENCAEVFDLTKTMLKRLNIKASENEIRDVLKNIHEHFLKAWEKVNNFASFVNQLQSVLDLIIDKSAMYHYPLNLNIADKIAYMLDELNGASFGGEAFDKEEMFRIFESKMDSEIVAFSGSPLKGLQLLGLFETRSLNFDHVIVLDVNEGVLPHLNLYEPLIPREVMISLGLDRMELEEEIQRYQFMRLISSAKNVHLIYQESKDKERSRFIEELIWAEEKKHNKTDILKPQEAVFQVNIGAGRKEVKKTRQVVEFLKNHRYSPSSINTYLRNPMDFYTNYVLGLREKEDLLDEPDAAQVGTFAHAVLEEQFKHFLNSKPVIDDQFIQGFFQYFEYRFEQTFAKSMKSDAFLLKSVLQERFKFFLEHERESEDRRVKAVLFVEKWFEDQIKLQNGTYRFGYIVDRIDRMEDGTIMIIDYKTGSSDIAPQSAERVANLELSREAIRDHIKSFQLPLYLYTLSNQYPAEPINAALYNLRTLKMTKFLKSPTTDAGSVLQPYLGALDFIMAEITDLDIPFIDDPV